MKLLRKTSNVYLLLTAVTFLIAIVVIYLVLDHILESQINEKMANDQLHVIQLIRSEGSVSNDPPFLEVNEIKTSSINSEKSNDTMLFDPLENEDIPFRQLISYETINGHSYRIIIRTTLIEKSDILVSIIITMLSVFTLLLVALFIINKKLSFRIWKPFYGTLSDLRRFSQDSSEFTLNDPGEIDEFKELNTTLEKLTGKVISDYQLLKRFTEDAAHEIQTPIAIIQSNLETLLQNPGINTEQARLIHVASSASARLSKLVHTLLLLTKIENRQFTDNTTVNLSSVISGQLEIFKDIINSKQIILKEYFNSPCNIDTNIFLAESLVRNLITNSVKYCTAGGTIEIKLDDKKLIISNNGTPLLVKPEKLFERFYKDNISSDSFGLGLSIVKMICDVYKWQINYSNEKDLHIISISF